MPSRSSGAAPALVHQQPLREICCRVAGRRDEKVPGRTREGEHTRRARRCRHSERGQGRDAYGKRRRARTRSRTRARQSAPGRQQTTASGGSHSPKPSPSFMLVARACRLRCPPGRDASQFNSIPKLSSWVPQHTLPLAALVPARHPSTNGGLLSEKRHVGPCDLTSGLVALATFRSSIQKMPAPTAIWPSAQHRLRLAHAEAKYAHGEIPLRPYPPL